MKRLEECPADIAVNVFGRDFFWQRASKRQSFLSKPGDQATGVDR
jgi:hypothetical protein